jgi:acetyl esterase/lipase
MAEFLKRRAFLKLMASGAASLAAPRLALANQDPSTKKTFTYKTVGACEIKADVYGTSADSVRPVVIWIHGGALIMGDRGGVDRRLREQLLKAGYALVSIDYRLAPETKLPAIVEDLQDAYHWVRTKGPELFHVSTQKLVVMGGSAGGYLTLMSGFRVEPRPAALVSFWGYGDIAGTWYSRPDAFYCQQPLVTKEEAQQAVGKTVLSEMMEKNNRGRFYLYCRQQGLWTNEVAALDPDKQVKELEPYCPLRNVSAKYPPTLLIHGTKDTDVPYEQSKLMDEELSRKGVDHEFITIPNGPHGLGGVDPAVVAKMYDRVLGFVNQHMG